MLRLGGLFNSANRHKKAASAMPLSRHFTAGIRSDGALRTFSRPLRVNLALTSRIAPDRSVNFGALRIHRTHRGAAFVLIPF